MNGFKRLLSNLAGTMLAGVCAFAHASSLDDIKFASLPGNEFEVMMSFSDTPPEPKSYTIDNPARIVLDFEGVESTLAEKKHTLAFENAKSAVVVTAGDRTRVILNLKEMTSYATQVDGNIVTLKVGGSGIAGPKMAGGYTPVAATVVKEMPKTGGRSITDVDFSRGTAGEGNVFLTLSDPKINVDVTQKGENIVVNFYRTELPSELDRRLDVNDFATPIAAIDTTSDGSTTTVKIEAKGDYDYLAYQTDNQYVVSVKPLSKLELEQKKSKFAYVGEKLSLNFQDIEVRSVLQLIADFTELNLVASDTVGGSITLRLENVPWDQALDIILKAKGLDKRQEGNVLMVAPAAEIAERERLQVEANKQLEELAPLVTEYVRIRYADAGELFALFQGGRGGLSSGGSNRSGGQKDQSAATGTIMSERGSAIVDQRTNTIIITDTEEKIADFMRLVKEIDIPIRQVEIEARIVIANTNFRRELGTRWGVQGARQPGDDLFGFTGGIEGFESPNNPLESFGPTAGGGTILVNDDALAVDLGVSNPAGSFAIELLTNNTFLDLELSALENGGYGEVVSQPKVMTGDKQKAIIKSGEEIAYQEATSSGATNVEFVEAVLKLEVTPQITPDNRVILDLLISQDSVGQRIIGGEPSIDVTEIETQALIGDGQTLVLGGIFTMEESDSEDKVPFLGDIPYLGRLFKSTLKAREKREILIFVTPRIIDDQLLDR